MPDTLARLAQVALESDEPSILRAVVRETASALQAPLVEVLELKADGESLTVLSSLGWDGGEGGELPGGTGSQAGFTMAGNTPVVLNDVGAEDRFEVAEARRGPEVRSGVSCPIDGVGGAFGVLSVHSPEVGAFGDAEVDRLRWIAAIVALAIARVRSERRATEVAEMRRRLVAETVAAEERTRKRLAEELHDGAIQDVVTAGYDLDAALAGDGDPKRLKRARQAIADALRELRGTVQDLHPVVLEAAGLTVALRRLCAEHDERVDAEFVVDVRPEVEGSQDRLLFELARELVGNASRHAQAGRVEVSTRREDDQLVLRVADDGRGMRPGSRAAALRAGHIGLASCAERVETAGGRFDVRSEPGKGTTVTARLPAAPAAPDD